MSTENLCLKILKFKLAVASQRAVNKTGKNKWFAFPPFRVGNFWNVPLSVQKKFLFVRDSTGWDNSSPRKQPTFGEATTGFPAKWRLRKKRRNSILMTRHYQNLGSAYDYFWLDEANFQPIRSTQGPDLGSDTTSDVIFAGKLVLLLLIYSLTLSHRKEIKKLVVASRDVDFFLRLGMVDDAGIPKSEWSNTLVEVGTRDILIRPADHSLPILCDLWLGLLATAITAER